MEAVPCWKKKIILILFGSDVCFKAQFLLLITNSEIESSRYGRRDFKHSDAYHRNSIIGVEGAEIMYSTYST